MRRVVAPMMVLALGLAGCTSRRPTGVDGDLTDDWAGMAPAKVPGPKVGDCYSHTGPLVATRQALNSTVAIDCPAGVAATEVAYVGTFTGNDADRATPPSKGSNARRTAFDRCQREVNDYFGGDWRTASVWLVLVLPPDQAWQGGARWFRCDVAEVETPFAGNVVHRVPAKDGLRGTRPLALTCFTTQEDGSGQVQDAHAVDCDQPHAAEFAGIYVAPDVPWPAEAERNKLAELGCEQVVARFLGFPNAGAWRNDKIGWLYVHFDEDSWRLGERTSRCFAYANTKTKVMVGSVKGIRTGTPRGA